MVAGNFGPVFVIVAAISSALVWRYAPEVGPKLPAPARDAILSAVRAVCPSPGAVQAASDPATAEPEAAAAVPGGGTANASSNAKPEAPKASAPAAAPAPSAATRTSVAKAASSKTPAAVARTAQNPTGSPFLEPAAKALREFRAQSEAFEKRQQKMSLADQRAGMKKLAALRDRVEFFNRKHREWKQAHPAASGSGR